MALQPLFIRGWKQLSAYRRLHHSRKARSTVSLPAKGRTENQRVWNITIMRT